MKSTLVFLSMVGVLLSFTVAYAQFYSAEMTFLSILDSPRAAAMGNCAANLTDEQSALYNPGALGLLHLEKRFALSYPFRTHWLPKSADDIYLKTFDVSAGMTFEISPGKEEERHMFSGALGYSRLKIDLGVSIRKDEFGNIIYRFNPRESADNFAFAMGVDYYLRFGLGATYKRARSELDRNSKGKANTYDIGFIAELPVADLISAETQLAASEKRTWKFVLTPSFAYVNANNGNDITYNGEQGNYRLPHESRTGFSLYVAGRTGEFTLLSTRFCVEMETNLVGRNETISKFGYEIGLGGTFYLREGNVDFPGDQSLTTYGFGFSLKGVTAFLYTYQNMQIRSRFWDDIIRHLDLSFDYAKYTNSSKSTLASTSFSGLSFSF